MAGLEQHRQHVVAARPASRAALVDQFEDELVGLALHAHELRERADPLEHLRGRAVRAAAASG